jgi:hypothetical protein
MLDSVDNWLMAQPSLVNARKKSLLPVVRERQTLADGLAKYLSMLGLGRHAKPVPTMAEWLAEDENGDRPDRQPIIKRSSASEVAHSNGNSDGEEEEQGRAEQ